MPDLEDVIRDARDLLADAVAAEREDPPDEVASQQAAQDAIDGKINEIIILTTEPNLKPFNAGQTFAAVFYDDRFQFLQVLRDHAADAYDEAVGGNDQAVIGTHLWTIYNSRIGLYALY